VTKTKVALAVLAVLISACASRRSEGDDQSRDANNNGGFLNAAATPLRDVGIIRPDVPDMIETMNYPYDVANLAQGCPAVLYEVGRLDAILGDESYQPGSESNLYARVGDAAGDAAVGAVAGAAADIVPYRSWVRRLSGANRAEREAAAAYALGEQRRAFLRGYGAALGCPGIVPAPPPPKAADEDEDD
jgi:hypothetical protein